MGKRRPAKKTTGIRETAKQFSVTFSFETLEQTQKFLNSHALDYGCRPSVRRAGEGFQLSAIVPLSKIERIRREGVACTVGVNVEEAKLKALRLVGKGDRFAGGKVVPKGLGTKISE